MFYNTLLDKIYSSKHIEISCLRDYILTLALYDVQCTLYIRDFKHMWYQIYEADYCLKHFKLAGHIK